MSSGIASPGVTKKKKCPPPKKCQHGVQYYTCKKCPGPGICDHGKVRNRCVQCGGSSVCKHGKLKYSCSDCKTGSAICSHGISKPHCKDCSPQNFCEHDKYKSRCKECSGGSFCSHGRLRSRCKECGGGSICVHGRRKECCRDCGGSAFCKHNRQKHTCRECDGKSLCPHKKLPNECPDCFGHRCCKAHPTAMCGRRGNPKYDGHCVHCFANLFPGDPRVAQIRTKSKEIKWVNAIMESPEIPDFDWIWDKPIYVDFHGGCCDTKRRIDLRTMVDATILAIEIDEFEHKRYPANDEEARYNNLFLDFSGRYVFLRINPDEFVESASGNIVDPPFEERLAAVCKKINDIVLKIKRGDGDDLVTVHHMFYSQ